MTPALPTMPRPGSMIVSGMRLPKWVRRASRIEVQDRAPVGRRRRHFLQIARRKAAAHVDHAQRDPLVGQPPEQVRRRGERGVPLGRIALLRADMEGNAVGGEAQVAGLEQQGLGHIGLAAELARQGPVRALATGQDAAEDARAGCGAGEFLQLRLAVEGEKGDAERMGARDVAFLFDRVAKGNPLRPRAGGERHVDLRDGGGVEAGAQRGE
jgi:hypothetical protein